MENTFRDAKIDRAAGAQPPRVELSRAKRRAIRRMAALARDADFYAFRTHVDGSVTWILRQDPAPKVPESKGTGKNDDARVSSTPSKRSQRSREGSAASTRVARGLVPSAVEV